MHSSVTPPGGSSGVAIGGSVTGGGVAGNVLFLGTGPVVAQNNYLSYDTVNGNFRIGIDPATSTVSNLIGTTTGDSLTVAGDGAVGSALARVNISSAGTTPSARLRFSAASGGFNSLSAVTSSATVGIIEFSAYDGGALRNFASIRGAVNGTVSSGTVPTDLIFSAGTTALTERMRILSSGRVGFGTTTPRAKVHAVDQGVVPTSLHDLETYLGGSTALQTSSNSNAVVAAISGNADTSFWPYFVSMSHRGPISAPTASQNGDTIFTMYVGGYDGTNPYLPPLMQTSIVGAVSLGVIKTETTLFAGNGTQVGVLKAAGYMTIVGTNTNNDAAAGEIGEEKITSVARASAVSVSTATAKTIATLALTAGDWEVTGGIGYLPAATTSITVIQAGASLTTDTFPATTTWMNPTANEVGIASQMAATVPGSGADVPINLPTYRVKLSANTNLFLVAKATFSVSTMTAYGYLRATRKR